MAEASRMAPSLTGPAWILALNQTKGRGRRGRAWVDPTGNFAATLVLQPDEPPATLALRSFVAALALYEALLTVTGHPEIFALKWPNDVLLNGGKVAGILLESRQNAHLSIGIGVNLAQAPRANTVEQEAVLPVSLQSEAGTLITPPEFLAILAPAYARYEHQFTTQGFAPIRDLWLARAARLGETITARTGTTQTTGVFKTINDAGHLILSTPSGQQAIPAADIFF
jgi:BirA family biotin operon repressor/biotin-[acetyl-CoA-carboxylase] ligase